MAQHPRLRPLLRVRLRLLHRRTINPWAEPTKGRRKAAPFFCQKSRSRAPNCSTKVLSYFHSVHAPSIDMPIVRHYSFYRGFARSGFMALTFRSPLLFIPAPRMFQSGDRCCDPTRTVSDGLLRLDWTKGCDDPRTSSRTAPGSQALPLTAKKAAAEEIRPRRLARFPHCGAESGSRCLSPGAVYGTRPQS